MKPLVLVCLSGVLLLGVQLPVRASFEAERAGARATGLAGAFTAVADDADALIYNPAGLPNVKTAVFSAEHSRLFTALDTDTLTENRLAYVQPWPKVGTFGLGWYGRNLADVYQENVIVAGAGFTLDQAQTWKAGAALKLLQVAYLDSDALA
ncbi:MAG: UPF0164 family protein, partial [Candidatus Firestonebacteria bacterium]|nr:UPF0164 family protein [Candidatus Firestonebacteria bacterium]